MYVAGPKLGGIGRIQANGIVVAGSNEHRHAAVLQRIAQDHEALPGPRTVKQIARQQDQIALLLPTQPCQLLRHKQQLFF